MLKITLNNNIWYYNPKAQLGRTGGFGAVYLGKDEAGQTDVAIKKLHLNAANAAHRELNIAEELSKRTFNHVMPVLDSGQDAESGGYFVVMPKAEMSLQSRVDKVGHFVEKEAVEILLEIAHGLSEVADIVHRDLKPDNILYHEGKWKITDFGIARFVEASTSLNTLKGFLTKQYAAPEQWNLERSTPATDIYALGCIAYTLLTGSPPFIGENLKEQHLQKSPEPITFIQPVLRSCISLMLRKPPQVRPNQERVIDLLKQSLSHAQNEKSLNGFHVLAEASADEAEARLKKDAEEAKKRQEVAERHAIAEAAFDILEDDIFAEFSKRVQDVAPIARFLNQESPLPLIEFGDAKLLVELFNQGNPISKDAFPESGWDVIVGATILIRQARPKQYEWGANLWFTNLGKDEDYRWYEVPYFEFGNTRSKYQPFAVGESKLKDADLAASLVSFTPVALAAIPPCAIDVEGIDSFCERWALLLTMAYKKQLRTPSHLPITNYCQNDFLKR